jgi:hypothetical protein
LAAKFQFIYPTSMSVARASTSSVVKHAPPRLSSPRDHNPRRPGSPRVCVCVYIYIIRGDAWDVVACGLAWTFFSWFLVVSLTKETL